MEDQMFFQLSRNRLQAVVLGCIAGLLIATQPVLSLAQDDDDRKFSPGETPPVRRIVFFNSGIAQVLHQGKVTGNQLIEISFDRNQIDDVLKSIVFDNESGTVESVQYQPAPGKELLAAERLGPPMTLAQTLQYYRGEQVTLSIDGKPANGSILGVETRTQGDTSHDILTLVSPSGLKTYNLTDLQSVQFDSKTIQDEFRLGMIGLSNDRDVQKKSLSLFFQGNNERKIQFGYVVDAPIWRMTYRLDLGEKKSTLQGWAHVDNVTGFDWENVVVDLRSGRPHAFNVELFAPLVAERPSRDRSIFGIPPELMVSRNFGLAGRLADTWNEFGQPGKRSGRPTRRVGGGFGGGGGGGGGGFGGGGLFPGPGGGGLSGEGQAGTLGTANGGVAAREEMDIDEGFSVAADQGRASRMLQFEIEKPINLASGRSAMLPILTQEVKTEIQTFFDLTKTSKPAGQLIVKMTNGKKFSIVAGPTTVYQQGNFLGDAALARTDVSETTKLAYGQDQPVTLEFTAGDAERINKTVRLSKKASKPSLIVEGISRIKHKFVIDNKDVTDRNVRMRLPIGNADATPKPVETTGDVAEFELDVVANRKRLETITLDTKVEESLPLSRVSSATRNAWKKANVKIDPDVDKLLTRYFKANTDFEEANDRVSEFQKKIRENQSEQDRLTKIIQAVKSETAAAPFVEKLTKQDREMDALRSQLVIAEAELKTAREALEEVTGG